MFMAPFILQITPCTESQANLEGLDKAETQNTEGPSIDQILSTLDIVCEDKAFSSLVKEVIQHRNKWTQRPDSITTLGRTWMKVIWGQIVTS